jgi:D-Lysine 5,6-aminomutase TIM-barrel domain of alpha subunit
VPPDRTTSAAPTRGRARARSDPFGPLDRLSSLAESLAGAWAARARSTTTAGQERAILRLFGVHGLDRAGRPLAGSVVDRWQQSDPRHRTDGVTLPFAMALLEYDLGPQQLALDVAAGTVDLAMEAELLREPDRRAVAEAEANRLAGRAIERIDANRVVRREILSLLGEPARPWIGMTLDEPDVDGALREMARLVAGGIDLVRVEIPVGQELADRMHQAGLDVPTWQPPARSGRAAAATTRDEPAPAGSQRALAEIRVALDEAAAERRAYARLATASPALGVPEGAVVAGFERIDLTEANPMVEIVADGVDPDRALSDHAFAHRLYRRAGTLVSISAGPLVVAPDLASGMPSDAPTRAGRALALQALAAAFARHNGLAQDQIVLGALPAWLCEEAQPGTRAVAEAAIRRALFAGHALVYEEPDLRPDRSALWLAVVTGSLPHAGPTALVRQRPSRHPAEVARRARAATEIAAEVAASSETGPLTGRAHEYATSVVAAAVRTLERLGDDGWRVVSGDDQGGGRVGRGAVVDRSDPFDPLAGLGS